jgi:hypothetical protein
MQRQGKEASGRRDHNRAEAAEFHPPKIPEGKMPPMERTTVWGGMSQGL